MLRGERDMNDMNVHAEGWAETHAKIAQVKGPLLIGNLGTYR